WWSVGAHFTHLHVTGVRAQQDTRVGLAALDLHPEAVLHVRRRVVRRESQLGEVVALELDLRTPSDLEAERTEDVQDLVRDLGDRMMVTAFADAARQRHVERWRVQVGGAQRAEQRAQPRFEG